MKILVTGGLGFIGANFIRYLALAKPDWKVVNLDSRTYAGLNTSILSGSNLVADFDLDVAETFIRRSEIPDDIDCVVHFAAETHNDRAVANPELFTRTNILGTEQLAKFCLTRGIHLHYVSTDEIYGDTEIESTYLFREDSPLRPSNPYSASKAAGGLLLGAWSRTFGLKFSSSACGNNFGFFQNYEKFIPNSIRMASSGLPIPLYGSGKNVRDWVHVDEHSNAIVFILERELEGSFNIGVRDEWSNLELAKTINAILGRPAGSVEFVGDRPGHDQRYALDNSKLLNLGWTPLGMRLAGSLEVLVSHYSKI